MTNLKKENNKKIFIVVFIVLLLGLAVGYAAFSDTLTISGTANASGSFDVVFVDAKVVSSEGVNPEGTIAEISTDKNTLTVVAKDLAYPGAGAQFHVVIKNEGTVPARITKITPNNITGNENAIVIDGLDKITTDHPTLAAQGTCEFDFTVVWDKEKELDATKAGEGTEEFSFSLGIDYEQDTTAFEGSAIHTHI